MLEYYAAIQTSYGCTPGKSCTRNNQQNEDQETQRKKYFSPSRVESPLSVLEWQSLIGLRVLPTTYYQGILWRYRWRDQDPL